MSRHLQESSFLDLICRITDTFRHDLPLRSQIPSLLSIVRSQMPVIGLGVIRLEGRRILEAICRSEDPRLPAEMLQNASVAACETGLRPLLDGSASAPSEFALPLADSATAISALGVPMRFHAALSGIALFFRAPAAPWSSEEQQRMRTLTALLSTLAAGKLTCEAHKFHNDILNAAMDQAKICLYISDPQTDKILYMNRYMKELFRLDAPEGAICWQVLQAGKTGRCESCPVDYLLKHSDIRSQYRWEGRNTLTGRIFENCNSLIPWTNGSLVHLQQSVDVTESRRLSEEARIDELTGLYNRRAGQLALMASLESARTGDMPLIVCLFDANFLKQINDTFGHAEGDRLLALIAGSVKKSLREPDFCFRLGGDEFVAVFHRSDRYAVVVHMKQVLQELREQKERLEIPYRMEFCFGCFEVQPGREVTVSEALAKADEDMYEHKKQFHIREAQRRVTTRETSGEGRREFVYDASRLYDALAKSTDAYMYVADVRTGTFRYSRAMVEEFDLPGEIVENAAAVWGEKVHPDDKAAFMEANQIIADGRSDAHYVEYRAQNRNGEWVWVRCRGHLERDDQGEPCLFAGFITNLSRKNTIDYPTGLYNRTKFVEDTETRLRRHPGCPMQILLLDLDGFRLINDMYTRLVGDEVLRVIARRIQGMLPQNASVYRLGGDEFGILVEGNEDAARAVYCVLAENFRHQQEYNGKKYFCPISAGSAGYPQDGADFPTLLRYADYALNRSKRDGKNRMTVFTRALLQEQERSMALLDLLRRSVEQNFAGFRIVYQPWFRADSRDIAGAEALARWTCEEYGDIAPEEFIPLLEQSGLILPFGSWAFRQAALRCREWAQARPDFVMSVNISPRQIASDNLLVFMSNILRKLKLSPANIMLEFSESCMSQGHLPDKDVFTALHELGVRIALENFSGASASPDILRAPWIHVVKLGPTFVSDVLADTFNATFIRCMTELCHATDTEICLYGVEREEERQKLLPMRPDYFQGFLFGHPMDGDAFARQFLKRPA